MSKSAPDPREALLQKHTSRHAAVLSTKAVEDLRWFCERAAEGRELEWKHLQAHIEGIDGHRFGRNRLATLAKEHGIAPYWSH